VSILRRSSCRECAGRCQARHLHPTIVRQPLPQNEPLFGHRIEVMGKGRTLDPDALREIAVADLSLADERHENQPPRQRPANSCEPVIECAAKPLGGLAKEQSPDAILRCRQR
jgi:hypothetical protein